MGVLPLSTHEGESLRFSKTDIRCTKLPEAHYSKAFCRQGALHLNLVIHAVLSTTTMLIFMNDEN